MRFDDRRAALAIIDEDRPMSEQQERRYGFFGLTLDQVREAAMKANPQARYLTPQETREALNEEAWFRCRVRVAESLYGPYTTRETQIEFEGKWLALGRTDLCDDVRTTISATNEQEFYRNPIAFFLKRAVYGARVTDDGFFVIDSTTDG